MTKSNHARRIYITGAGPDGANLLAGLLCLGVNSAVKAGAMTLDDAEDFYDPVVLIPLQEAKLHRRIVSGMVTASQLIDLHSFSPSASAAGNVADGMLRIDNEILPVIAAMMKRINLRSERIIRVSLRPDDLE